MLLLLGLLLIFIFGLLLSTLLVSRMHLLERVGISFLLGFGIFTLLMFCYSTLGLRITLQSTIAALIFGIFFMTVIGVVFKRKIYINLSGLIKSIVGLSWFEKTLVLLITSLVIASLVITIYFPVYIWDAIALYDFRAKIIAQLGFYTQIANNFWYFGGYPLFTSLSHTFVYLFGGKNPQFLYTLMYLSFILIFYSSLRQLVVRKIALMSTCILATTPVFFDHSTFAYTNLPYSIFLSLGTVLLFVWFAKNKSTGYLILAALMTGLSTWTRSTEPFWIINILLLLILAFYKYKKYLISFFVYILSFFLIREPWSVINYYILNDPGIQKTPIVVDEAKYYSSIIFHTTFNWDRIIEVSVFLYKNVITSWYPLIFLFIFCLVISFKGIFTKLSSLFLLVILTYLLCLSFATYVYSIGIPYWNTIPDSARRMSMFFIPLLIFYVGLVISEISSKRRRYSI